jgi:hypothetical protein
MQIIRVAVNSGVECACYLSHREIKEDLQAGFARRPPGSWHKCENITLDDLNDSS